MITSRHYFSRAFRAAVRDKRWDEAFRLLEATDIDLEVKGFSYEISGETALLLACSHAHLPMWSENFCPWERILTTD